MRGAGMLGKGNIAGLMEKMKQADVDLEKQVRCMFTSAFVLLAMRTRKSDLNSIAGLNQWP